MGTMHVFCPTCKEMTEQTLFDDITPWGDEIFECDECGAKFNVTIRFEPIEENEPTKLKEQPDE